MNQREPKYPSEEFARRGGSLYQSRVRAQVEEAKHGKIVAIDIDTGEYELGDQVLQACDRLLARRPDAQIWCVRIGFPAVHTFGPSRRC